MELLKSNYENDILLNGKIKELKEIEKYLNLSQTKAFISNNKKKESLEKQLNSKYVEKENKYKIDLYKLNYEMRDLLLILERNKGYYDKYKEIEQREKKNNSENSYMKVHLSNELEKKNTQYKNEKELNNDLNEEILHLEKIINDLKNKNEELKMEQIQFDAKIKRLFGIINERNENIRMMNEELNYYSTMYYKEIKSHDATKILLLEYKKKLK
jgi:FtsZ-binding cell division protein ZapB